ncbi:MAG: endonuclease MutS2 [Tissierellia bacterium]|nr:endonuclease MutS2 [Tissierellia bacterium]
MNTKALKVLEYNRIIEKLENLAESQPGKRLCTQLSPYRSVEEIQSAQQETTEAVSLLHRKGSPPLFGIYDMKDSYHRAMLGGALSPGQLLNIGDSLRVIQMLKKYSKKQEEDISYPIIDSYISLLTPNPNLENLIDIAIISPDEISDDASSTLRSIRRKKASRKESIQRQLQKLITSANNKKYLQDSLVTMRGGRYVVPVKSEHKGIVDGLVHDVSSSGATVFIEPTAVVNLNNELRQLDAEEDQEIHRILQELSGYVGEMAEELTENLRHLTALDFAFAKAKLSVEIKGTEPLLTDTEAMEITEARHPLLNKNTVVPIDIKLGGEFSTLIITGPNTGGKTVALKTAGLLTLMAQSGLHIPAREQSTVRVFNEIYADIGDEQSIEQSLSTFSSHMVNIVSIMKDVGPDDFVLFDELGAGTDPTEGAALAMAILENLLKKKVFTMATTHYSQLKVYALTTPNVVNGSMEFNVETLSPTYRLSIGLPGKSNAFEISKRLGLSDELIADAKGFVERESIEFEDVLQALERDRIAAEEQKQMALMHEMEAEANKIALSMERKKLSEERDKIIQQAREEARKILRQTKEESRLILDEIKDITYALEKNDATRLQQAQEVLKHAEDKLNVQMADGIKKVKNQKAPKSLKPGDSVEVLTLGYKGTVLEVDEKRKQASIQVGAMKLDVKFNSLKVLDQVENNHGQVQAKRMVDLKASAMSPEIDVRGKNIEEARIDIDKYLDDAYISGLKEVQIIHGKGTGALREGLQPYLKKHRHVASTRVGGFHEGGTGVTVVELK